MQWIIQSCYLFHSPLLMEGVNNVQYELSNSRCCVKIKEHFQYIC